MNKKACALILLCSILIMIVGCNKKTPDSFERIENHYGYDTNVGYIEPIEGYSAQVEGKGEYDGKKYLSVHYYSNDGGVNFQKLFLVNEKGVSELGKIDMDNDSYACYQTCIAGYWVVVAVNNEVIFYDLDSSIEKYRISFIDEPSIMAVEACGDGMVLLESGRIVKCDLKGKIVTICENEAWSYFNTDCPFYEDENESYAVVLEDGTNWAYYKVDFDSGKSSRIMSDRDISNTSRYVGKYVIDYNGEYKIDCTNLKIYTLADWNDIDIQPVRKALRSNEKYMAFDDTHFAVCYEYSDGSIDIVFLTYNPDIDFSKMEKLVIGGYGVKNDLLLRWAVYNFNTTQNEYRVFLDDYVIDYGYTTRDEAQANTASLIQHLNNGSAPDIYYGSNFDYISLFKNGMTQDIYPYVLADNEFDLTNISESVRNIIFADNQCVYMFASYTMNGYVGLDDYFGEGNDVSISDLITLSDKTGIAPISRLNIQNIVDYAIRYSMWDFINKAKGQEVFTQTQLEEIIDFAIQYGMKSDELINEYSFIESIDRHEYLMSLGFWGGFTSFVEDASCVEENLIYIGYPSINGSVHTFNPWGQVAMSSSTDKPDVCWEFMKSLLSYDVQTIALINGQVPVDVRVVNELVQAGKNPDDTSLNENIRYYSTYMIHEPITEDVLENYLDFIYSIDTPVTYDWGVYNIICDEIYEYENQGKPPEDVAESLCNRLKLYVHENYDY